MSTSTTPNNNAEKEVKNEAIPFLEFVDNIDKYVRVGQKRSQGKKKPNKNNNQNDDNNNSGGGGKFVQLLPPVGRDRPVSISMMIPNEPFLQCPFGVNDDKDDTKRDDATRRCMPLSVRSQAWKDGFAKIDRWVYQQAKENSELWFSKQLTDETLMENQVSVLKADRNGKYADLVMPKTTYPSRGARHLLVKYDRDMKENNLINWSHDQLKAKGLAADEVSKWEDNSTRFFVFNNYEKPPIVRIDIDDTAKFKFCEVVATFVFNKINLNSKEYRGAFDVTDVMFIANKPVRQEFPFRQTLKYLGFDLQGSSLPLPNMDTNNDDVDNMDPDTEMEAN